MKCGRFGVLEEKRDVADAECSVAQEGLREVSSHLIK